MTQDKDQSSSQGTKSINEIGDRVREDIGMIRGAVTDHRDQLMETVSSFVEANPLVACAAAFGVGYVLSGALVSKTSMRLFGFGTKFMLGRMLRSAITGGGAGFMLDEIFGGDNSAGTSPSGGRS